MQGEHLQFMCATESSILAECATLNTRKPCSEVYPSACSHGSGCYNSCLII